MATKSSRNVTMEQYQAMWPGVSFTEDPFGYMTDKPMSAYIATMPGETTKYTSANTEGVTIRQNPKAAEMYRTFSLPIDDKAADAGVLGISPSYILTPPGASMTFSIPDSELGTIRGPIAKITPMQQKQLANMAKEAVKADNGKPDWSLVPFEALEGMVRVLEFGANKYSRNNWMTGGGFSYRRVLTACMRHLFSYLGGEDKDPESGLSHIHHAQCNLLFLAMYITNKEKFNKDDRESR
jgi:hypothetical protein